MSEEMKTPTRLFFELGDAYISNDSVSDGEEKFQSQLLDHRMTSSEVDKRINGIVALLSNWFKMLIQSLRELNERSSTRSTEGM